MRTLIGLAADDACTGRKGVGVDVAVFAVSVLVGGDDLLDLGVVFGRERRRPAAGFAAERILRHLGGTEKMGPTRPRRQISTTGTTALDRQPSGVRTYVFVMAAVKPVLGFPLPPMSNTAAYFAGGAFRRQVDDDMG